MLQRPQERQQVGLLLFGKAYCKTPVVKIDDGLEIFREPVVEIRGTRGQPAEDWAFEAADVFPLPRDQRASRISGDLDLPRGLVAQRVERHVRSAPLSIGEPDVQRGGDE